MRLLNVYSLKLVEFNKDKKPAYAIASHRWDEHEATFADVRDGQNTSTTGYQKVKDFADYVKTHVQGVDWLWIDTCCINKESAAELSRAINLMFEWYRDADICLAYLRDVPEAQDDSFERSEWFERGWTLQELLAPRTVVFLTRTWEVIGNKGDMGSGRANVGQSLEEAIARTTKIPLEVLQDYQRSAQWPTSEKLQWMEGRKATEEEDLTYALFGILNVFLGANYGERGRARDRLLAALREREELELRQAELYGKIASWLSPANPWQNHQTARKQHEPETGAWLLQCERYRVWKASSNGHLWLYGPAGSGKTILCSTAINDVQAYCRGCTNVGQAIFYFSFSDQTMQSFENLVRSMVVQLGQREQGVSLLRKAYERPDRTIGLDELYQILTTIVRSYDRVFLHLDGLDECLGQHDARLDILASLAMLLQDLPNIQLIATSRDYPEIRSYMESSKAIAMPLDRQAVDSDIRRYVSTQLARDMQLRQWPASSKKLVEDTLAQRAQGMFRWAVCQLQEMRKIKASKPKLIRQALSTLPETLDETYGRMLTNISEYNRADALTLLRWITYAKSPRTLRELAEATIIELPNEVDAEGVVDVENLGGWADTLAVLAGLVTIQSESDDFEYKDSIDDLQVARKATQDAEVRLAHFSVQEFLESKRVLASDADMFHLDPGRDHGFIARSCLMYLQHYSSSIEKCKSKEDLEKFPLLQYASETWFYHTSLQQEDESCVLALSLLTSGDRMRDWLTVYRPDQLWVRPFQDSLDKFVPNGLYYASFFGLEQIAEQLLKQGADVNAKGDHFANALSAASYCGHKQVVALLLLVKGVDIDAQRGFYGNALQAASASGNIEIVILLLDKGADVNAQGSHHGNALEFASDEGHFEIVKILLDKGADVNARGGIWGSALYATVYHGRAEIAKLLLDKGAKVFNYDQALKVALKRGHAKIVKLLLNQSPDGNAAASLDRETLENAAWYGHVELVTMLLDMGIDVNAQGGHGGNALQAASTCGHAEAVKLLLDKGAEINAKGGHYGSALQAASNRGHAEVVKLLLDKGADINATGGHYGNALQAALDFGHVEIARLLLDQGASAANLNVHKGRYSKSYMARHHDFTVLLSELGFCVDDI